MKLKYIFLSLALSLIVFKLDATGQDVEPQSGAHLNGPKILKDIVKSGLAFSADAFQIYAKGSTSPNQVKIASALGALSLAYNMPDTWKCLTKDTIKSFFRCVCFDQKEKLLHLSKLTPFCYLIQLYAKNIKDAQKIAAQNLTDKKGFSRTKLTSLIWLLTNKLAPYIVDYIANCYKSDNPDLILKGYQYLASWSEIIRKIVLEKTQMAESKNDSFALIK